MNNPVFVGIDTSNYTTSVAVTSYDGNVILNLKKLLPVKEGERGLRQSDAVFHHTNNIYSLLSELKNQIDSNILSVGASVRPRDVDGSYMPCFLVGRDCSMSVSLGANCSFSSFSHQAGHIMAALYSSSAMHLIEKEFIAFHVSGGTTDILYVKPSEKYVFDVNQIGGTKDLNAGQIIDRIGVAMGFRFPAGPSIEAHALDNYQSFTKYCAPITNNYYFNFSGIENKALKLFNDTNDSNLTSAFVIDSISNTLEEVSEKLTKEYKLPIVYAGGVMSCSIIKNRLNEFGCFATPEFSSDNAAGISLLTRHRFLKNER